MKYYDKLIFELSKPGRTGYSLPDSFDAAQQQLPFGNRATLGIVRGGTASEAQRWGPTKSDVSEGQAADGNEYPILPGLESSKISLS